MGLQMGNLPIRIRKILYYGISPMEQRAWAKSVSRGLPNLARQTISAIPLMAPAFIIMTGVLCCADGIHKNSKRKDPKQYENDT